MTRNARSRRGQRGQVVPIVALTSTVLLGFTALAVDLGLQTDSRRALQNATDAAALAGAHHLQTATVTQAERQAGVEDAIEVLHTHLQWPLGGSTLVGFAQSATTSAPGCAGTTSCSVSFTAGNDTVSISTPPTTAHNGALNAGTRADSQYFEVNVSQTSGGGVGGAVGLVAGSSGAHSVAYHFAPSQPFGFALYADQVAQDSNFDQVISGNVYAYRSIQPQSNGHSATCAQGGAIVLGDPQAPHPTPSPDPAPGQPQQAFTRAPVLTFLGDCGSASGGMVAQTAGEGCPGSVQGVALDSTNSYVDDPNYSQSLPSGVSTPIGTTKACVAYPAIPVPDLGAPSLDPSAPTYRCGNGNSGLLNGVYQPGIYTCGLTVDHPLAQGVYEIVHNSGLTNDVTISSPVAGTCIGSDASNYDVCLYGVTFYLQQGGGAGASIYVGSGGGITVKTTPYCPCPSTNPNDGHFPIYAPRGVTATLHVDKYRTLLSTQGTVYMPSGITSVTSNADVAIDGQAIVNTWVNQGGNHPNPRITYDANTVAQLREILRLEE